MPHFIHQMYEPNPEDLCCICGAYWKCDCLEARISLTPSGVAASEDSDELLKLRDEIAAARSAASKLGFGKMLDA